MSTVTAEALVEGPRGRRLCLELLFEAAQRQPSDLVWDAARHVHNAAYELDPGAGTSVMRLQATISNGPAPAPETSADDERMSLLPPAQRAATALAAIPLPQRFEESLLRGALVASVGAARYWQEPDGEDVLAAQPELRPQLLRIAEVVARSDAVAWWGDPLARLEQVRTAPEERWLPSDDPAAEQLARWAQGRLEAESRAQRERPADPTANWSGEWWSMPPNSLRHSTRAQPTGPFGLDMIEDGFGWNRAETRALSPAPGPVLELDGPGAWADLCRRWPMVVQASSRHDWYRVTGEDRRWVAPDWRAVAAEYAAVHLSVLGYLRTATRLIELGDGRASVLAGWDPDATYWLRDGAVEVGEPQIWSRPEQPQSEQQPEWAPEPP